MDFGGLASLRAGFDLRGPQGGGPSTSATFACLSLPAVSWSNLSNGDLPCLAEAMAKARVQMPWSVAAMQSGYGPKGLFQAVCHSATLHDICAPWIGASDPAKAGAQATPCESGMSITL